MKHTRRRPLTHPRPTSAYAWTPAQNKQTQKSISVLGHGYNQSPCRHDSSPRSARSGSGHAPPNATVDIARPHHQSPSSPRHTHKGRKGARCPSPERVGSMPLAPPAVLAERPLPWTLPPPAAIKFQRLAYLTYFPTVVVHVNHTM